MVEVSEEHTGNGWMVCSVGTEEWDKSQELTVHDEEVYKEGIKTVRRKPVIPCIKKEHN